MGIIIIEDGKSRFEKKLKVDGFRLCIAFSKFLCSPVELLLSLQIPCWHLFHERKKIWQNTYFQSCIYLVLFLVVRQWVIMAWNLGGCSSTKSRGLQEGTSGWTQPIGCWRPVTLGIAVWEFWSSFSQRCLMVCVARALNVCLPPCGLFLSNIQHLCLLWNYDFSQVAGGKQVMTGSYLWFWSSDRETPLKCISDAGKR